MTRKIFIDIKIMSNFSYIVLHSENVEIIHTDGDTYGFSYPIGTKDVYPNYGRAPQPGVKYIQRCEMSHVRAVEYFAETLTEPNNFIADKCMSYEVEKCEIESSGYKMGGEPLDKGVTGIFYLRTNDNSPYGRYGRNSPDSEFSLKNLLKGKGG